MDPVDRSNGEIKRCDAKDDLLCPAGDIDDAVFELYKKKKLNEMKRKFGIFANESASRSKDVSKSFRVSMAGLLGYFSEVVASLSVHQRSIIFDKGFGALLYFENCHIPPKFVKWISSHINAETSTLEVKGRRVHFDAVSVHKILGIPLGGRKVFSCVADGRNRVMSMFNVSNLPGCDFFGDLIINKETLTDDQLCTCFSIVALSCFLCPNSKDGVLSHWINAICNVNDVKAFDWSHFVYHSTLRALSGKATNQTADTSGICSYFLSVLYLDCLVFGSFELCDTVPRICIWRGSTIKFYSDLDYIESNNQYGKRGIKELIDTHYTNNPVRGEPSSNLGNNVYSPAVVFSQFLGYSVSPPLNDDLKIKLCSVFDDHCAGIPLKYQKASAKLVVNTIRAVIQSQAATVHTAANCDPYITPQPLCPALGHPEGSTPAAHQKCVRDKKKLKFAPLPFDLNEKAADDDVQIIDVQGKQGKPVTSLLGKQSYVQGDAGPSSMNKSHAAAPATIEPVTRQPGKQAYVHGDVGPSSMNQARGVVAAAATIKPVTRLPVKQAWFVQGDAGPSSMNQAHDAAPASIKPRISHGQKGASPEVLFIGERRFTDKLKMMSNRADAMYNAATSTANITHEIPMVGNADSEENLNLPLSYVDCCLGSIPVFPDCVDAQEPLNSDFPISPRERNLYNAVCKLSSCKVFSKEMCVEIGGCFVKLFSLGESMQPNGEVGSFVINCLCRKFFLDERPTSSLKHYFFSWVAYMFLNDASDLSYVRKCFIGAGSAQPLLLSDSLFFPACHAGHWFLFVVDLKNRLFLFLDSLHNKDDEFSKFTRDKLIRGFCKSWLMFVGTEVNFQLFRVAYPYVPKQDNIYDCGVFVIKFMEMYRFGCNLTEEFTQADIPNIRVQIVYDLITSQHNKADKKIISQIRAMAGQGQPVPT